MRRVLPILALGFVLLAVFPRLIAAQSGKLTCDPASVIKKAASLSSAGDTKKDMDSLLALKDQIDTAYIACSGWMFTGKGRKVLDPIVLLPATYKLKVKTTNSIAMHVQSLPSSDCEAGKRDTLFNEINFDGDRAIEAEALLPIKVSCRVVLSTENTSTLWTLTIEPIQ